MNDQPQWQDNLRDKVKAPAMALIIFGVLSIAGALFSVIMSFFGEQLTGQIFEGLAESGQPLPEFVTFFARGGGLALNLLFAVVNLGVAVFITYYGTRMSSLRDHSLCVTAAILTLVPCFGPCCLIGMPIGIWALVILNRADVRSAFQTPE